jgi:hypothetical protein
MGGFVNHLEIGLEPRLAERFWEHRAKSRKLDVARAGSWRLRWDWGPRAKHWGGSASEMGGIAAQDGRYELSPRSPCWLP